MAAYIQSGDELVLTEMVFDNAFKSLNTEQLLAACCCFVCQEKPPPGFKVGGERGHGMQGAGVQADRVQAGTREAASRIHRRLRERDGRQAKGCGQGSCWLPLLLWVPREAASQVQGRRAGNGSSGMGCRGQGVQAELLLLCVCQEKLPPGLQVGSRQWEVQAEGVQAEGVQA